MEAEELFSQCANPTEGQRSRKQEAEPCGHQQEWAGRTPRACCGPACLASCSRFSEHPCDPSRSGHCQPTGLCRAEGGYSPQAVLWETGRLTVKRSSFFRKAVRCCEEERRNAKQKIKKTNSHRGAHKENGRREGKKGRKKVAEIKKVIVSNFTQSVPQELCFALLCFVFITF